MKDLLVRNFVGQLGKIIADNGGPASVNTAEDVIKNLFYLSKEGTDGIRYIPLHELRLVEKVVCGAFNTYFKWEDNKDVYFTKVGETGLCVANVYLMQRVDGGEDQELGHGFHTLSLGDVLPGVFMSDGERIAKWKAMTIGGAKSRALHDAGIGLEFYGDVFAPEETQVNAPLKSQAEATTDSTKSTPKDGKNYTEEGLPVPAPKKRGRPKKAESMTEEPISEEPSVQRTAEEIINAAEAKDTPWCGSLDDAKKVIADIGNYKGSPLGTILTTAPKNILFLARKSEDNIVRAAATAIIDSDDELKARFSA